MRTLIESPHGRKIIDDLVTRNKFMSPLEGKALFLRIAARYEEYMAYIVRVYYRKDREAPFECLLALKPQRLVLMNLEDHSVVYHKWRLADVKHWGTAQGCVLVLQMRDGARHTL
jgi:hypothetical protein